MDTYQPTHKSDQTVPEEHNANETRAGSVAEDNAARLQEDLTKAKTEAKEWHERFLRKAAEFENFRKRNEKEKLEFVHVAKSSVLLEFLPVLDATERALESLNGAEIAHEGLEQYKEGVQLLYRQMRNVLTRLGVSAIEAQGKVFDPHVHEAVTFQETAEVEEHTVIKELRRGFLYKDRLLRPAQVLVATRPKEANSSKS